MTTHNFYTTGPVYLLCDPGKFDGKRVSLPKGGGLSLNKIGGSEPDFTLIVDGSQIQTELKTHDRFYVTARDDKTKASLRSVKAGDSLLVPKEEAQCLIHAHLNEAYHDSETVRIYTSSDWRTLVGSDVCTAHGVRYEGEICLRDVHRLGQ